MSKPWFWGLRANLHKVSFFAESNIYKQVSSFSKARSNTNILLTIGWIGLKSLFWITLTLFMLIFAEDHARQSLSILPELTVSDKEFNIEQLRLYAQVLTAIFSIYFATIGIILSAGYTRLRRDIIQLLTNEQVGNIYSKLLVFSAMFCLASTALPLLSIEPGLFIFLVATFLTLISSLALFPLGQRLFNFFDLNILVHNEIIPKIVKHIESAANARNSIALANHHSKAAKALLEQLSYIDDRISADKESVADNLPALTDKYSALLMHYLQQKHKIDQDSYWFPRQRRHRQWFFAGDTATNMALQTSSQLIPEEKPDLDWLETEIVNRLAGHIELAFSESDFDLAFTLINRLHARVFVYARGFHFELGMGEINKFRELIETAIQTKKDELNEGAMKTLIAISDAWIAYGSNLCLELCRRMMTFESDLDQFFTADQWTKKSFRKLPPFLQVNLAHIIELVEFEVVVAGYRLSQPKYLQQLTIQKLLEEYAKICPMILEFQRELVPSFAKFLAQESLPKAATQVVLSSLNTYWKIPRWLDELSVLFEKYEGYSHYGSVQYALPKIDLNHMLENLMEARDSTIEMLGSPELFAYIFTSEHDNELPDHFGQTYYELAEECISALENNQAEKFEKLIPIFLSLAILAADAKFADPSLEVNAEFRLHLVSTALEDLASVMGFAILYAEYHENPKLAEKALNHFFAYVGRADSEEEYLTRMVRLSNSDSFSWSASPRSLIRTQWKMSFEQLARQDGLGNRMGFGRRGSLHKSSVVNAFMKSTADASHLFYALKIVPRLGSVDFKLDYRIDHLVEHLKRSAEGGSE